MTSSPSSIAPPATSTVPLALPAPRAARLRRPSWRDPRLLIGLVLVLGSVALGSRVVAVAQGDSPFYVAATTLPAGHRLVPADLNVVRARLGDEAAHYLVPAAGGDLPADAVLTRTVPAGELIPRSAVGSVRDLQRRPVLVPVPAPVPDDVKVGATVDIWSAPRLTGAAATGYGPAVSLGTAEIYSVTVDSGGLSVNRTAAVQVLVDAGQVAGVLNALANNAKVTLVPRPGAADATPAAAPVPALPPASVTSPAPAATLEQPVPSESSTPGVIG